MTISRLILLTLILLALPGPFGRSSVFAQGGTGKLPGPPPPKTPIRRPISRVPVDILGTLCIARSPKQATGRIHTTNLPGGVKMELIEMRAGTFCMGSENGSPDEKPVHKVTIKPFYIGKYEVTQEQWQKVMGNNPSASRSCGGSCPVEQVSWDDAQRFIARLNELNDGFFYRLPSEAEWEYAARAGSTGDYAGNLGAIGWFDNNSGSQIHPVGQKQANDFGLYDMHGNVSEWAQDFYHLNLGYRGAPTDGSAWESGSERFRVVRGGSARNNAANLRSSARGRLEPGARNNVILIGFRVAAVSLGR